MLEKIDDEKETSKWRLTKNELKTCKGFEGITDEQAEEIIDSLVKIAIMVYNV